MFYFLFFSNQSVHSQSKELDSSSDGEESSGHEAAHECVMRKFVSSAFGSNHPMNKNNILYTGSVQHLAPSRQQSDGKLWL